MHIVFYAGREVLVFCLTQAAMSLLVFFGCCFFVVFFFCAGRDAALFFLLLLLFYAGRDVTPHVGNSPALISFFQRNCMVDSLVSFFNYTMANRI